MASTGRATLSLLGGFGLPLAMHSVADRVIFRAEFLEVLVEVPAWPQRGRPLPRLVFGQTQLVC